MTGSGKLAVMLLGAKLLLTGIAAGAQARPAGAVEGTGQTATPPSAEVTPHTPADMPPNPPKVTCNGGQLTILAVNSTMGAVLNAIRSCTGAEIDVPQNLRGERLFADLGPGPVRSVIAEFLSSTDFDYVIKASPADPQKVETVLLNPRTNTPAVDVTPLADNSDKLSANRQAWLDARRNYVQSVTPPEDESARSADPSSLPSASSDTVTVADDLALAQTDSQTPALAASAVTPNEPAAIAATVSESSASLNQARNTQEMIGDMRRLFEQRKQMIQQQTTTAK